MPLINTLGGGSKRVFGSGGIRDGLFLFNNHTFTNADTYGIAGPTLSKCITAYTGAAWATNPNFFNMTNNGVQLWTVPSSAIYRILARGATGASGATSDGSGGRGAKIGLDIWLTKGDIIRIVVGQPGGVASNLHGGGGGGTYVIKNASGTPAASDIIVIAGGGGGRRVQSTGIGIDGNYGQLGSTVGDYLRWGFGMAKGSSASSGFTINNGAAAAAIAIGGLTGGGDSDQSYGSGGGGLYGDGETDIPGSGLGGMSFISYSIGGYSSQPSYGGFGGGGSGNGGNGGGGGGGYTGGNGGHTAGGGGSFVSSMGTNFIYGVDSNPGPASTNLTSSAYSGYVFITTL